MLTFIQTHVALSVVLGLVLIFILWWIGTWNGFRVGKIDIEEAQSGIEVALAKRHDVLEKLLGTVKSHMRHEKDVLFNVVKIRKGMSIGELAEADASMNATKDQLMAVAEQYPALKSDLSFVGLQDGIRDTEEHLQAARRLYNSNVSAYNKKVVSFPSTIVASVHHFTRAVFFEASATQKQDVSMDF